MKDSYLIPIKKGCLWLAIIFSSVFMLCSISAAAATKRTELPLDGSWKTLTISEKADVLWYDFIIPSDGKVEITMQTFRGSTCFVLYNDDLTPEYNRTGLYDGSASTPESRTFTTYLSAGTYHIQVTDYVYGSGFDGAGDVRIKMNYVSAGSTEKEPNNTFADAMTLPENSLVTATLILLDDRYDFYKFSLPAKKDIILTLTSYADTFAYTIYDEEYIELTSGRAEGSEQSPSVQVIEQSLDAGTYYVKISDSYYLEKHTFGKYTLKWNTAPCKEHTWDDGKITTQPTCTVPGARTKTCTNCNTTTKEIIPATGHTWDNGRITAQPTCTAPGVRTKTCTNCNTTTKETIPATGHTPGEWKTTKAATGTQTGEQQQQCKICGAALNKQSIAKITVTLNATSLPLQVKKSTTALKIKYCAAGDTVKGWESSKPGVVSVNSVTGKLKAKKTGTAIITLTMNSGAKATCKVKVQKNVVKTTKLTISEKSVILKKGKTLTINVTRKPLTANDKLTFKSSNTKVASVSSKGKIKAKKKGKATITVKAASGKKATIKITVK